MRKVQNSIQNGIEKMIVKLKRCAGWLLGKLKKPALWFFGALLFLTFFSLAMAFCVRYVTNERLITDAALALEDSVKARRQGECLSGEWGEYRAWGRYEPKMWHQIAMLHDVAQSPLTTS